MHFICIVFVLCLLRFGQKRVLLPLLSEMAQAGLIGERINVNPSPLILLCALSLSIASSVSAVEATKRITQHAHIAWRMQDGLFSGIPRAITQTTDGYIWIATQNGLLRFDGVSGKQAQNQ